MSDTVRGSQDDSDSWRVLCIASSLAVPENAAMTDRHVIAGFAQDVVKLCEQMTDERHEYKAENERLKAKVIRLVNSRGRLLTILERLGVDTTDLIKDDTT